MLKTYQFKTQCKGDIHSSKTADTILPGLMSVERLYVFKIVLKFKCMLHGCWLKQLVSPSLNTTSLVHVVFFKPNSLSDEESSDLNLSKKQYSKTIDITGLIVLIPLCRGSRHMSGTWT